MNPFLQPTYGTPHETVPFQLLTVEYFEEAFHEGMRQEDEAIARIVANPEVPTFANTIEPCTDKLLARVSNVFFNMLNAHTNDAMDELAQKISPLLTEHSNRISMNDELFQRVKYVHDHPGELNAEQQKLLANTYQGFVRSGALLNETEKQQLAALKVELAKLTLQFDQNELKSTNAFSLHIEDESLLSGLPQTTLSAARQAAKEKNKGGWIFTLQAPSYVPFMAHADNRELREKMYRAKMTISNQDDEWDNKALVLRIVNLRRQIAQLLGYACYADYALEKRMAQTKERVAEFINQLLLAYKPTAEKDVNDVETLARSLEGDDFCLQPWDYAYYSQKLRLQRFNLDSEMLRPYLPLQKVKEGIFQLATTLYGITFHYREDIPVYHPDVEAYDVIDKDGSYLAVLYTDFFPRNSKQSGAWMTSFQDQFVDDNGQDHRPHVSITMNLTKPTEDKPSLLTLGEVETFLHEFGHALHGIFSRVHYSSLSGTNVYWDFVELPSQFMENYATQPAFLQTFAKHYQTNELMPDELIQRVIDSRNFQCGYACLRQLSFSLLDMAYYTRKDDLDADVPTFEHESWKATQLLPVVEGACMSTQFGHIMSGGYSAGYYSYKWAEVLDADAFGLFIERGIFDQQTAFDFRQHVLSRGGTEHPMNLYIRFRGQQPSIDALLKRNNIANGQTNRIG